MNNYQLFKKFIKNRKPEFYIKRDYTVCFCFKLACIKCPVEEDCAIEAGDQKPVISMSEYNCYKEKYPEYFV